MGVYVCMSTCACLGLGAQACLYSCASLRRRFRPLSFIIHCLPLYELRHNILLPCHVNITTQLDFSGPYYISTRAFDRRLRERVSFAGHECVVPPSIDGREPAHGLLQAANLGGNKKK